MLTFVKRRLRAEDGAIVALAAVLLFALTLGVAFVLDIANWQEHRRHLQVQVDAGALAAGHEFTGCFQDPVATNANVARVARRFAGDPNYSTTYGTADQPFNLQVDDPSRVALNLNAADFPPGLTDFSADMRPDLTGTQSQPCDALMLDVKATDQSIPSFFGRLIPDDVNPLSVKAKARVEIRDVEVLNGFLPWAIPEVDPKHVAVVFMNEASGAKIMSYELTNPPGGITVLNGSPLDLWQGSIPDLDVATHTGMIVVTSRLGAEPTDPPFDISGSLATICAQAKTACYSGNTATSGLLFIRGNQTASGGAWNAPVLGSARLTPGNCTESSAPYFLVQANCNVGVEATVDFGAACGANPSANPCRANVTATGPGCGGSTNLTFDAGTGIWSAVCGNPKITDNSGQNPVRIAWSAQNPSGSGNASGTFAPNPVARVYAKDTAAGPIEYVSVTPNPAPTTGPTAVSITVGLPPSLQVSPKIDPPILLRFKQTNGPNTQQVDCDASPRGPDEEIGTGCQTKYDDNETGVCPPQYDEGSELPPGTTDPTPIPTCAAVRPGSVQSMVTGLAYRFENPAQSYGSCPPNNWPKTNADPFPSSSDPRWVILIVTDISAFKAPPGQDPVVPILKWAGFYVTGWDLSSKTTGCPGINDPHPFGFDSNSDNGDVWGHFVNYVPFIPGATASEKFCNFNEIGICIAVLTQ